MELLKKTVLAILFAILLIQVLLLVNSKTPLKLNNFTVIGITGLAAGLYYFIFERKKKKK